MLESCIRIGVFQIGDNPFNSTKLKTNPSKKLPDETAYMKIIAFFFIKFIIILESVFHRELANENPCH